MEDLGPPPVATVPSESLTAPAEPAAPVAPIPPAPARPRWHPLLRSILFLVSFVVVQAVTTLLFALTGLEDDGTGAVYVIAFALTVPLLIAVTVLFLRFLDRADLRKIGVRPPDGGTGRALRQAVVVPVATVLLIVLWTALVAPFADLRIDGLSEAFRDGPSWWSSPAGSVALLVLLLLGFLIQGGVEEWVMRGYIYHALRERWPWWASALVSSVLFSALHGMNPDISAVALLNIVLAGVILAQLVERSGSLWSATLAHGVWNFTVACLLSLNISGVTFFQLLDVSLAGPELLTGGGFGPEGSLLLTGIGLVLMVLLWPRGGRGRERAGA
jgi:membrane protease YdiL (CAAX protease family)